MTEPGAGSDLQGMRTTATKDGDYYVLNGSKTYITNGWHSDMVIVCAKTDVTAKGSRGISLFLVDANTPGFVKGRKLNKLGLKVLLNLNMRIHYAEGSILNGMHKFSLGTRHRRAIL
jgi:alkylation response protein AidB-like acyl-CoA dehydrogenase